MQREVADRRADRLDQRVSELLDSRTTADARERELVLELKRSVQGCAEIEAKARPVSAVLHVMSNFYAVAFKLHAICRLAVPYCLTLQLDHFIKWLYVLDGLN